MKLKLGKNFFYYNIGQLVSSLGDVTAYIALSWWVLQKTGSGIQFAAMLTPVAVIQIFLKPLLAPIIDRNSRKSIMIFCDIMRICTSTAAFLMVYFDYFNLSALIVVSCLGAIFTAGFDTAVAGLTKFLVPEKDLASGIQVAQILAGFKGFINPSIAGAVTGFFGPATAILLNIVSFFVALIFNFLLELQAPPSRSKRTVREYALEWWSDLCAGFSSLIEAKVILQALLLSATFQFLFSHLHVTLPVLILKERKLSAWHLGLIESALGAGALVGALTIAKGLKFFPGRRLWIVSFFLVGMSIFTLGFFGNIALGIFGVFVAMIFQSWLMIQFQTRISLAVPSEFIGRTFTFMGIFMSGTIPLGMAMSGGLIEKFSAATVVSVSGLMSLSLFPFIFMIPFLKVFLSKPDEQLAVFISETYPKAFRQI